MEPDMNTTILEKLQTVFDHRQATVLAEVISDSYRKLVKTSDFNELKAIVRDLVEAQKRTGLRVEELAEAQKEMSRVQKELSQAQKEFSESQRELSIAQKQTAQEVRLLARSMKDTRDELGGLSRSVSNALENEAYRLLPAFLKTHYGLESSERLVRVEMGGRGINIFGRAIQNGQEVLIVGETKLRLDERRATHNRNLFFELEQKINAVREAYPKGA